MVQVVKSPFKDFLERLYPPLMRLLILFKPLFIILGIFYSIKNPENAGLHWGVALIVCFFMIVVGTDIGLHRYDSHKAFKTAYWKRILILFWSIPSMSGSPLHWAVVHRKHHAECDTEEDPHSPIIIPWWKVWFYIHPAYTFVPSKNRKYYRGLISDRTYLVTHSYYFLFVAAYILLIYFLFGLEWVLFGMFVPSAIVDIQMSCVNVICHLHGYESFKTKKDCNAKNNWLVHALTFFSFGFHNNHHADPGNHRTSKNKGEFDLPAWIIEVFFLSKEDKAKLSQRKASTT